MKSGKNAANFFPPFFSPVMSFDPATLARLANLARIDLPARHLSSLGDDMSSILSLIDQLLAVDTQGVEPLSHPLSVIGELTLRLRADRAITTMDRDVCLANAPDTENGLFLVPKVLE